MCTLTQLEDGTYGIDDLQLMNDIIELKYIRRQDGIGRKES